MLVAWTSNDFSAALMLMDRHKMELTPFVGSWSPFLRRVFRLKSRDSAPGWPRQVLGSVKADNHRAFEWAFGVAVSDLVAYSDSTVVFRALERQIVVSLVKFLMVNSDAAA